MASEELEAFLASISEPATVTEEEAEDSRGGEGTTDSNERVRPFNQWLCGKNIMIS